jgi:hypothetical protein
MWLEFALCRSIQTPKCMFPKKVVLTLWPIYKSWAVLYACMPRALILDRGTEENVHAGNPYSRRKNLDSFWKF